MTKIAGSGSESGSISQMHGSADPDPDPPKNVMDPQHGLKPQVLEKNHPRDRRETNTVNHLLTSVVNQDPTRRIRTYVFGPPGSGIICTDPDHSIITQKSKKKP